MNNPDIAVIVPVYNTKSEYLKKCIDSILGQSLNSIELILISDGAKDELVSLMKTYLSDERVSLYEQENAGVSAARNLGIENAKAEYITFVDSDDYIDKNMCRDALKRIKDDDLTVLLWGSYKFDDNSKKEYMPYDADIHLFDYFLKKQLMLKTMSGTLPFFDKPSTKFGSGSACSKLYRRDFLMENNLRFPVGIKRAEDVNFHIRVFDAADRIGYLNKHFYYYRQDTSSATYQYRDGGISVFTDALNCLYEFIKEKDVDFLEVYYMRCMFFFLESMDMDYLNKQNAKPFKVRAAELKEVMNLEPYKSAFEKMSGRYLGSAKKIPLFLIRHRMASSLMLFYGLYKKVLG